MVETYKKLIDEFINSRIDEVINLVIESASKKVITNDEYNEIIHYFIKKSSGLFSEYRQQLTTEDEIVEYNDMLERAIEKIEKSDNIVPKEKNIFELNDILDKIIQSGLDSLSKEEKEFLNKI
jgi:hypothetical protein